MLISDLELYGFFAEPGLIYACKNLEQFPIESKE